MTTNIVKFKQLYKIIFKEGESKIITSEFFYGIKEDLKANKWIDIDDELYNPFEIKRVIKYQIQDGITERLKKENYDIQKKVKDFMKIYNKELTLGVLENMIKKAKGIDI